MSNEFSFNVWDTLERESQLPIPSVFDDAVEDDVGYQLVPEHALPRRFWAKAALGVIARNRAIVTWCMCHIPGTGHDKFEDVLAGLSAFMDVSPYSVRWFIRGAVSHLADNSLPCPSR